MLDTKNKLNSNKQSSAVAEARQREQTQLTLRTTTKFVLITINLAVEAVYILNSLITGTVTIRNIPEAISQRRTDLN